MGKKQLHDGLEDYPLPSSLTVRLHAPRSIDERKNIIQNMIEALTSSGYMSLDDQATALGLPRSTVWTIRENKHKVGRLCAKTIERILANPDTPPRVLAALQEYAGAQGANSQEQKSIGTQIEN
jgi:hypothetical protein